MTTLYIRDVPPDVADILRSRAEAEGCSLSAYVATQLTRIAARPVNGEIVQRLRALDRSGGPSAEDVVEAVAAGRR